MLGSWGEIGWEVAQHDSIKGWAGFERGCGFNSSSRALEWEHKEFNRASLFSSAPLLILSQNWFIWCDQKLHRVEYGYDSDQNLFISGSNLFDIQSFPYTGSPGPNHTAGGLKTVQLWNHEAVRPRGFEIVETQLPRWWRSLSISQTHPSFSLLSKIPRWENYCKESSLLLRLLQFQIQLARGWTG